MRGIKKMKSPHKRKLAHISGPQLCWAYRESVQLSGPGVLDVRDLIQTELVNPSYAAGKSENHQ